VCSVRWESFVVVAVCILAKLSSAFVCAITSMRDMPKPRDDVIEEVKDDGVLFMFLFMWLFVNKSAVKSSVANGADGWAAFWAGLFESDVLDLLLVDFLGTNWVGIRNGESFSYSM